MGEMCLVAFNKNKVENIRVYLAAEVHGVVKNTRIKFDMLRYLNQEADVGCLLIELGCYEADAINSYLECGKKSILQTVVNREKCYANTEMEIKFYEKLYQFNKTLPSVKKIRVCGIDCNSKFRDLIYYMEYLIMKSCVNINLKHSMLTILNKIKNMLREKENIHIILKSIDKLELVLKSTDFEETTRVIRVLSEVKTKLLRRLHPKEERKIREEYMAKRILDEVNTNIHLKCFGQLGYSHIFPLIKDLIPLSQIIKRETYVIKIMFIYNGCKYIKMEDNVWEEYIIDMYTPYNSVTKKLMENNLFPIKLEKEKVIKNILREMPEGFYIVL